MYAWYLKKPLGFSRRVSVHLEKGLPQGVSAVLPGEALPKKRGPISRYQHPERGPSQDAQGVPQEAFGISRSGGGLLEKPASRDTRAPSSREAAISRSAVASRDGSTSRGSFSGCTATYLKKRAQLLEKREQLPEKRPPRDTRAGLLEERHLEKRARILRKGGVSQDAQDTS